MKRLLILICILCASSAWGFEIQMFPSVTEHIRKTTGNLSGGEVSGTVLNNYGAAGTVTVTAPAIAAGYNFVFVTGTAQQFCFDVNGTDVAYLDGTALTAGNKICSAATPAVGAYMTCFAFQMGASTWRWNCVTGLGSWADGGA